MSNTKHLWEYDHPYYCNLGNYFASDCCARHGSWAEFFDAEGDADLDMNLLFRWDWELPDDDDDGPIVNPDPYYRDGVLYLFYLGQRKGIYRWAEVSVCQADEAAVREWLAARWEHMRCLWEGVSDWTETPAQPEVDSHD